MRDMARRRVYNRWHNMMSRCYRPTHPDYKNYGSRGITVCERWHDFENFVEETADLAFGFSMDRIDNDGNYEPDNIRIATHSMQRNNIRINRKLTINGVTKTYDEWAVAYNIDKEVIRSRVRLGWTPQDVIETPVAKELGYGKLMKASNKTLSMNAEYRETLSAPD